MTSTEEWDAKFERDGETAVRDSLAAGGYLDDTAKLAREWLRQMIVSSAVYTPAPTAMSMIPRRFFATKTAR
jgi:hypothetical protein